MAVWNSIYSDSLADGMRLDGEYYSPKYQRILTNLSRGKVIGDVADLSKRQFTPVAGTPFRYIQIGDVRRDGYAEPEERDGSDAPSRAQWVVKHGDVITSTVRPIRCLTAIIEADQDGCVCSSGFAVLTPRAGAEGIEPEVLSTYLRLPVICEILDLHTTASMYPAIAVDRLMRIPIVVPDTKTRKAIVATVQEPVATRRHSRELLEKAKKTVEDLIAGEPRRKI